MAAVVAGCGAVDDAVGFDTPQVAALDLPGLREHFAAEPMPLTGSLRVLANGCMVVAIDGVDAGSFHAVCGVDRAPVMFPDASTVVVR